MPRVGQRAVAAVAQADEPSRGRSEMNVIGQDLVDQSKNDFVDYTRSGQVGYRRVTTAMKRSLLAGCHRSAV